jgi:hypothetical protein
MARSDSFIHRPNTLPQTTSHHQNFSLAIGRRTIHCPKGVPSRPTPSATGQNLGKGTQTCFGAGVRTLQRRAADFGKESVRPKGGGVLSGGTLNADRKANGMSHPV